MSETVLGIIVVCVSLFALLALLALTIVDEHKRAQRRQEREHDFLMRVREIAYEESLSAIHDHEHSKYHDRGFLDK